MQQNMISIGNAPRDLAALCQLKRRQLYLLATNLKLLSDDQRESAFLAMSPEQQAQTVLQGLQTMDASGGVPMEAAPQQQPQMMPPQPVPQMAPPPMPAQPVTPPPAQMPAPVAPPMAPPQMPQAPVAPPMAPAAPMAAPPMPPQPMPPQPMVLPPAAFTAPQMPQAPMPVPAAPPMAPLTAMPRTPQTATDPGTSGPAPQLQQLVAILTEMNASQQKLAAGIDALIKSLNGSVLLQRVILQILLTQTELQGMDADALIKQVRLGDADAVEKFVSALGTSQGKS